jgi:hypothetical protein
MQSAELFAPQDQNGLRRFDGGRAYVTTVLLSQEAPERLLLAPQPQLVRRHEAWNPIAIGG